MAFRLFLAATLAVAGFAWADIPIINGGGRSLSDLANSDDYVTLVLKNGQARVRNVRIRSVNASHGTLSIEDVNGRPGAFKLEAIGQVYVQDGKVSVPSREFSPTRALREEDRDLPNRGIERAVKVFSENDDQALRMKAAALTSVGGRQDAIQYLESRLEANDLSTAVEAALFLYLAGEEIDDSLLSQGLQSGDFVARGKTAKLAGLLGRMPFAQQVRSMLRDPSVEIWPRAAIAAGRLGLSDTAPTLVEGLSSIEAEKAEAAVVALQLLGGDTVKSSLYSIVDGDRQRFEWFRAVRVLYALDDPEGQKLMKQALDMPAFDTEAAIVLAKTGDWQALQHLRDLMEERRNPSPENLIEEARAAVALYEGEYVQAKNMLQQLLRMTPSDVYLRSSNDSEAAREEAISNLKVTICLLIVESNNRNLISLVSPVLNTDNPRVALAASDAAVAITDPAYRDRLTAYLKEPKSFARYP